MRSSGKLGAMRVPVYVGVDRPTQTFITRASSPCLLREPVILFLTPLGDMGTHSRFISSTLIGIASNMSRGGRFISFSQKHAMELL